MITLNHVDCKYNEGTPMETEALHDVILEIRDGEFIGLIGHTGSGKSTLIQHLNGLMRATSGDILYNGTSIYGGGFSMKELRSHVGLVFQYPEHQLFEVDVFSDVCFGPKNLGLPKEEVERRAKEALRLVGLKEKHITVVLVSHSMEDVARYVERIIVMNKGQVMFDDTPQQVFQHYRELESVGLAAPQVTYLMHDLKEKGWNVDPQATTVEEAAESIFAALHKKA